MDGLPFDAIPEVIVPEDVRKNPVAFLLQASIAHAPIFRRRTPPRQVRRYGPWQVYLIGPEANRFVLHAHRQDFLHAPGWRAYFGDNWNENLMYQDGDDHAASRRVMTPALGWSAIASYLPAMHAVILRRTSDWAERGVVDMRAEMRDLTFEVVAEALLGFAPTARVQALHEIRNALVHNTHPYGKGQYRKHAAEWRTRLNTALQEAIATRPHPAPESLISRLLAARDAGIMDNDHLLGHLHVLMEAGHTTTMETAAWSLGLLAAHPEWQDRAHEEALALEETPSLAALKSASLIASIITEAGRLRTPVDAAPRGTARDVTFAGYTIPQGTFVRLHLGASHRLPEVFHDPDVFDPSRFMPPRDEARRTPYGLVLFGGGPRICIGMPFAMIELAAMLAHVLRHYSLRAIPNLTPQNVHNTILLDDALPRGMPIAVQAR
jgi:retinoid hydroxylase